MPRNLRRCKMPPCRAFSPDWELFTHHFITPWVDPSRPRFPEKWQFILAQAFCKRSLDAAHKRGVEDSPPPEVRWLGSRKPLWQDPAMKLLWRAAHQFVDEAGLHMAPLNPPAEDMR